MDVRSSVTVQLMQLNRAYGKQHYIPYSAGMLTSYVQQFEDLRSQLDFRPFLYRREPLNALLAQVGRVDVFGISCYVWNWRLSMAVAEKVREENPDCLIVVGGPHVPDRLGSFFEEYPFLDIAVHGEGELTFKDILEARVSTQDYSTIPGLSFHERSSGRVVSNGKRPRITDLDEIPSPYLTGVFDELLEREPETEWMVMWETNRGCPYSCAFCDWGSAVASKLRRFEMERLKQEIAWFARQKITWVFGCDANFGILKRDLELAQELATQREQTGYPWDFRVCFAKNSNNRVFQVAKILHDAEMSKGVSLSMQSMHEETLRNIKRHNIKLDNFQKLQTQYNREGMATYSEIIIGLPGETVESFVEGLDLLLEQGQHSGINIYNCTVMPNAEMGDPAYQRRHGLKLVELPIFQAHSARPEAFDTIVETEPIVVGTSSLSTEDWKRTYEYAWVLQCFHLLGLMQAVSIVLRYHLQIPFREFYLGLLRWGREHPDSLVASEQRALEEVLERVLAGEGFDQYLPEFLDISWPVEEASFLRFSQQFETFYEEMGLFVRSFLKQRQQKMDEDLLQSLLDYQKAVVVHPDKDEDLSLTLPANLHEFVQSCREGQPADLCFGNFLHTIRVQPRLRGDVERFAREVVWYGRKGGRFLYPVEVTPSPTEEQPSQIEQASQLPQEDSGL
jgi:radical SAM superfamily enzyme YgiQ (UPF0313 family)